MTPQQSDKLVLQQAIQRHKEREDRQKREITIPKGDGWVSKGSVFDCNRHSFQRSLEAYDNQLYVGWNPMKNDGRGCWEIWRRPNLKTPILAYHDEITGLKIYRTEYRPNDFEHWVADLDFLNRDFIKRLKEMDAWENKQLISKHDDDYEESLTQNEEKEAEHLKYVVRHNKSAFKDLLEYTQQGFNPLDFFKGSK